METTNRGNFNLGEEKGFFTEICFTNGDTVAFSIKHIIHFYPKDSVDFEYGLVEVTTRFPLLCSKYRNYVFRIKNNSAKRALDIFAEGVIVGCYISRKCVRNYYKEDELGVMYFIKTTIDGLEGYVVVSSLDCVSSDVLTEFKHFHSLPNEEKDKEMGTCEWSYIDSVKYFNGKVASYKRLECKLPTVVSHNIKQCNTRVSHRSDKCEVAIPVDNKVTHVAYNSFTYENVNEDILNPMGMFVTCLLKARTGVGKNENSKEQRIRYTDKLI